MKNNLFRLLNDKGVTAIVVAILLTVFLGITALAVDLGYIYVAKNELQNAADAAALAGVNQLAKIYKDLGTSEGPLSEDNRNTVVNVAINTAAANKAAGENVTITDNVTDITFGKWTNAHHYVACSDQAVCVAPDAVYVNARRNEANNGLNGRINTFFANIFGQDKVGVSASAVAALTGVCEFGADIPLAVASGRLLDRNDCNGTVSLGSITNQCMGWTNFTEDATVNYTNGNNPGNIKPFIDDPANIPDDIGSHPIKVTNGTIEVALQALIDKYGEYPNREFKVPVFDGECGVGYDKHPVLGWAVIKITRIVLTTSIKGIEGEMKCEIMDKRGEGCDAFWSPSSYGSLVQQ